jgi:two-component system cell cycle sensor histidine kinase/response regulator CckA
VLLAHSVRTAKQMARWVNHDFNNLISVVRGYASILQGNPHLDEDSKQLAGLIEQAGAEIAGVTDRLACFADPPPHDPARLNLNKVFGGFLGLKRSSIPEGVNLQIDLAEFLPDLLADGARLMEVCNHLWQNAIKSMPHGGKLVWQTSICPNPHSTDSNHGSEVPYRYLRLRVIDSGGGMDRETIANIFTPFFTTKPGKGRGLGATVVYEIVKSHGGHLEVSAGAGPGSCVDLYFPSSDDFEDQPGADPGSRHQRAVPLCWWLTTTTWCGWPSSGCWSTWDTVQITAASGEEALDIYELSRAEIAAIILDITMPGLGGIETFRRLRAWTAKLRSSCTSGDPLNPAIREMEAQGISCLLAKPSHTEQLARAIQQTIG